MTLQLHVHHHTSQQRALALKHKPYFLGTSGHMHRHRSRQRFNAHAADTFYICFLANMGDETRDAGIDDAHRPYDVLRGYSTSQTLKKFLNLKQLTRRAGRREMSDMDHSRSDGHSMDVARHHHLGDETEHAALAVALPSARHIVSRYAIVCEVWSH